MKKVCGMSLAMALSVAFATLASAQQHAKKTPNPATKSSAGGPKTAATEGARPLILSGSVPMEGVKGRFDHFAFRPRPGIYFRHLAIHCRDYQHLRRHGGAHHHWCVGSSRCGLFPRGQQAVCGQRKGQGLHLRTAAFNLITTIDFPGGADNLRYDAATKRIYVGCGDDEKTSAIAGRGMP